LLSAARQQNMSKISELLAAGADPNAVDSFEGTTVLHYAAFFGHLEVVKAMIAGGADPNYASKYSGDTPLILSAIRNYPEVASELLAAGADVDKADHERATPLLWAAEKGRLEVLRLLLDKGADVELSDFNGITPLMAASVQGDVPVVKALLEAGADPNHADKNSLTPAHLAASRKPGDDSVAVLEMLIDAGANVDAIAFGEGGLSFTPLWNAAVYGNVGTARLLLERGADANLEMNDGKTAGEFVCYCDKKPKVTGKCPKGGCDRPETAKELKELLTEGM